VSRLRLGLNLAASELPVRTALGAAARAAVACVSADAVGELDPTTLSDTGRRELRTLLRGANLELASLHCPLSRGLDDPERLQVRLEHLARVMKLSIDLGPRLLTMPLPRLPAEGDMTRAETLREALTYLAAAGDRFGVVVAVEPGLDGAAETRAYLDTFDTGSLAVNFDPANVIAHGRDPAASVTPFAGLLRQVRARDCRAAVGAGAATEAAVGRGVVDWPVLLATLEAAEYRGDVIVDRGPGPGRWDDVLAGVQFLRQFLSPLS
jgi:L-ribulose-5-phosphate 3-epimerase